MTDRFHTHDPLRLQGTIKQVVQSFPFGCRAGQTVPTEMASRELISLQHSDSLTNRHQALVEGHFQNALGRLAAGPRVIFFHRLVLDVADGERAVAADARQHSAQVTTGNLAEPVDATLSIPAHVADKEPQALRRHVR